MKTRHGWAAAALVVSVLGAAPAPSAPPAPPRPPMDEIVPEGDAGPGAFDAAAAHAAVETLASLLEADFIYPEIGRAYADMLRGKLASGAYSRFRSAGEFAGVVTADLQAAHPEGHLRLQPPGADAPGSPAAGTEAPVNGVGKAGWLAPGVAYMSLHGFSGTRAEYAGLLVRLREALGCFSTARTLVVDARPHLGGALEEMDVMFSHFFDRPTTVVEMDTRLEVEQRRGSPLAEGETLKRVAGPEGIVRRAHVAVPSERETALRSARIFLLTSGKTASAGEHLALALKRTGRATLIGETTAGAGHFGRTVALDGGYRAFIPVGRTFDPDTGQGWEQTGVEPHVQVPADRALDEALRRSGAEPEAAKRALESLRTDRPAC